MANGVLWPLQSLIQIFSDSSSDQSLHELAFFDANTERHLLKNSHFKGGFSTLLFLPLSLKLPQTLPEILLTSFEVMSTRHFFVFLQDPFFSFQEE